MVTCLKNDEDFIYAYIEWQILDEDAQFKNGGEYCFIQDLWVHPAWRKGQCIPALIPLINEHKFMVNVKYIYWTNLSKNEKLCGPYNRRRFVEKRS